MKKFNRDKFIKLNQLKKNKEIEENRIKQIMNMVDRKNSLKLIDKYKNEIENIEKNEYLNNYVNQVSELIDIYRNLGTISKVISFKTTKIDENKKNEIIDEKQEYRQRVISRYLDIARHYINLDIVRESDNNYKCLVCNLNFENTEIYDSNSYKFYCPNCNTEKQLISRSAYYKDSTRISTSSKNNYEDRENFEKSLKRYQGKQPVKFNQSLFISLDNFFKSYDGKYISENVKKLPLDHRGRRLDTNKDLMYKALFDTGNAIHYEDINLICHLYWGWKLPDVSHLEDDIMNDYDLSQKVYESIKTDRKSCLNTQYRLFRHLRRRGHNCRADDFKIVKTRDILEYHENMWEQICNTLGWYFEEIEYF